MIAINWTKVGIWAAIVAASATAVFLGYRHYNGLVEAKVELALRPSLLPDGRRRQGEGSGRCVREDDRQMG